MADRIDLDPQHLGTVERTHGGAHTTLRFERQLDATPEEVWRALTDPAELAVWFGCPVDVVPGERIAIHFADSSPQDSRIVTWEPPSLLAFEWDDHYPRSTDPDRSMSLVTFELERSGAGTRLVLVHSNGEPKEWKDNLGGWHGHLVALREHLAGRSVEFKPLFVATIGLYQAVTTDTWLGGLDA
ncbi:MAG: hypothetical protein CVU47_10550 [Chloroflexi bacterium HGW-Chloroflexi-9]|nr:MAG: hypothetical protein CVU47_10550 [Chloroflexi bacterium HGW-Chloroflexi-9]